MSSLLRFAMTFCNQVSNQTSCVQPHENSNSNSDTIRPIPKAVVNAIRNTLNSYPKGISITELRSESGKSNVTIHKDWLLQSQKDGQPIVHGINTKSCGPDTVSGPSTTKDTEYSIPIVSLKEDVAHKTSMPPEGEILSASSNSNDTNLCTESPIVAGKKKDIRITIRKFG
ncbi:hypothetical protein L1987_53430 [Smallanthus sonchifolius]|uniref:Uncharacterized protein n=1 Tax=Smallanthus sonchifolius TaxID=185202 RepID=A0ACB9EW87_9ASTR|nr:hypothetical protein L1987_53430 [Smallanthus sonchifolius]